MKKLIKKLFINRNHNDISSNRSHSDISKDEWDLFTKVSPYTMTSIERIKALIDSINYVSKNNIEGDIVECGVWKGGSVLAAIIQLNKLSEKRLIWLYDTFEGMSNPIDVDVDINGRLASKRLNEENKFKSNVWAYSPLEEVKRNLELVENNFCELKFVKGKVEETLLVNPKSNIPENISLLRLDTDWYESTKIELEILFPRVVKGGVLIIDDYGHWKGCKLAVDEYFSKLGKPYFLHRIDYTGRILIKNWDD